ncbi:MBOAT family protein [Aquiflexum sp.]|uniref:MBOAT family O-acyltransferase n=1 Tax=Aquiflexum sp. TaxID=1872584 RepID=UPI0035948E38
MLFNSFEYLIFLPVVFLLYWFVFQKNLKAQNLFLLVASYVFYGWWDWRFLGLIAVSSSIDFVCGLLLGREGQRTQRKQLILGISLMANLGLLGFFKYFNFFVESTVRLLHSIGFQANEYSLQLILPVGISFYTFQTMSYTIDIYRGKVKPTNDIIAFFAYVGFFPQLVAGPIERASHLLPQFFESRKINYSDFSAGLRLILWGLFKKMVVADNCAPVVDWLFANHQSANSWQLMLGLVFFTFQIYGDFSGYSDIAIGTARTFGLRLKPNFRIPFFSRDIAEFWRNWHISLYTWFRDYVYFPLGGNKGGLLLQIRNVLLIFLLSALWHGASFHFVFWGLINFFYILPLILFKKGNYQTEYVGQISSYPSLKETGQMLLTFSLIALSFLYFRAPYIGFGNSYFLSLVQNWDSYIPWTSKLVYLNLAFMTLFIGIEWKGRSFVNTFDGVLEKLPKAGRIAWYYSLVWLIILFGGRQQEFYYFQF